MNPLRGGWLVGLTFFAAATLAVAHLPAGLPEWVGWLRPAWVPLVLFFWILERPHRIGLISVWAFGLLLDVVLSEPLGLNGFALTVMAVLGLSAYERLRMINVFQQAAALLLLVLAAEFGKTLVVAFAQGAPLSGQFVAAAAVTALLWPLVVGPLRWATWRAGTA
ncbi:MAG: rod shape-determining protein MreD [Gammaproteobacteria bacterium]|nr:rod shape-determining protein MreD [Gammaproteobacteria bacterium]